MANRLRSALTMLGIIFGVGAVIAAVVAVYALRSDRAKDITDAAMSLLQPLRDRVTALEAEMTGLHNENARLERCLAANGIDVTDCQ